MHIRSLLVLMLILLLAAVIAHAGGGPQNVLIVVNAASAESRELGNAYRRARNVPYRQLLALNTSTAFSISYQTYQEEIETPIRNYLKNQQLEDEIYFIVLTRGLPQQVLLDPPRSTASLLASLNLRARRNPEYAQIANPYQGLPMAFSHRPEALQGMYLVTVLNGYNNADILGMIARGVAADGTLPSGRFLLQSGSTLPASALAKTADLLKARGLTAELADAPPDDRSGLLAYVSGGAYSGLSSEQVLNCGFQPGAIADMAQNYGASANNFDESVPAALVPVSWFVRAGVTGVQGAIGEAGLPALPISTGAQTLFDRYTSGFALAESFYAALPTLNWQNVILGDPLCTPYAQRPVVSIDLGLPGMLKEMVPVAITATAPARGTNISRVDVYLDDRFVQTLYEPENTQIILRVGDHALTYTVPRGVTLRLLLEGLAAAVNSDEDFQKPDGVRAVVQVSAGTLQLIARQPGAAGNGTAVSVNVVSPQAAPVVSAHTEGTELQNGGHEPTAAKATLSFVGRKIIAGDEVTVKINDEKLTYSVGEGKNTISDLLEGLVALLRDSPALKEMRVTRDQEGMPFITLEAATPGDRGNANTYMVSVKTVEGSQLRAYPDTLTYFRDGHNGSAACLDIRLALGLPTVHTSYLLNTTLLSDGYHRLRVVAYDGSTAQVQGNSEVAFTVKNQENPPQVTLPEKLEPASSEITVAVTAAETVKRVDVYVDGQLLGAETQAPFAVRVSLATLGRGWHDLWAEGFDEQGNSFAAAPIPLEVINPPETLRISPDHTGMAGGVTHRIVGTGFKEGCMVRLAGIPVRSVTVLSPNLLEVVSDAGPARRGWVEVSNPDGTVSKLATAFEYYVPKVADIRIQPAREVLATGQKAQFTAQCTDQFGHPIQATVNWSATGGTITPGGVFTAKETAGSFAVRASHPDTPQVREAPVTIGPADLREDILRHWLVLGPFADADHKGLETSLFNEAMLFPSHAETIDGEHWQSIFAEKDYLDFNAAFTPQTNAVAYAHLYLYSPAIIPCTLSFGSDDGIRIWLNGTLLYTLRVLRAAAPNQNVLPITLQPGWNRLLVKVDQQTGDWGFYMRLKFPDQRIPTGLKYGLDKPPVEVK